MKTFETNNYLIRLLDKTNKEEVREVQKLRYDYLLKDFNPSLPDGGLDDDGFDDYCDSILVIDKSNDKIVGTYRVSTMATARGHEFKCEEEFDITALKNDPDGMVETGRAVVHGDYRNGTVVTLLWDGLIRYTKEHGLRYFVGTASLHGTDYTVHRKCLSYLALNCVDPKFKIRSRVNSFEYYHDEGIALSDPSIPSLLKTYLLLGAKVSENGYIDYEFNSCDVLIILDVLNINERMLKFIMR